MLLTFGHGTASEEQIGTLLRDAGVVSLVDIRIAPGSRRHPHVARAELERWLPGYGIRYRWEKRLGGHRTAAADSPDTAWRVPAFRGYAGYMREPPFAAALDEVLAEAAGLDDGQRLTVMCSESVWWRCHRRLVADFTELARGAAVQHLMHDGRLRPHQLSEGVRRREGGLLVYDGGQPTML